MTKAPDIPKVYRRRRTNLLLSPDAVDAIREHVLPLLPGVSLSDIVDSFLQAFAGGMVPVIVSLKNVPEEVRAGAAESAMAEMLGRFIMGSVRTDAPLFPPTEVDDG
jgi:hypothetical protein